MSSAAEPRRGGRTRGASIARPIFLLVIVSVLVATAISFVVTFSGPPPFDRPHSLRSIAMTLTGELPPPYERGGPPPEMGKGPLGGHGPGPLRRRHDPVAPHARAGEVADPAARLRLAAELDADPDDVLAFTESASEAGRDAFVGSYTFA